MRMFANTKGNGGDAHANENSPLMMTMTPLSAIEEERKKKKNPGMKKGDGKFDSTASFGSSYADMQDEIEDMLCESEKDAVQKKRSGRCMTQKWVLLLLGMGISSYFLFLIVMILVGHNGSSSSSSGDGHGHSSSSSSSTGTTSIPPFSTMDPVHDLSLREYTRSDQTSPPPSLHKLRQLSDGDSNNGSDGADGDGGNGDQSSTIALPTNAWYQNMLQLYGEPESIHRLYVCPYMVDVVGRVPGLRMHQTHIDAFNDVVQASFSDQFGMTLGALPAEWDADLKTEELSKAYTVSHATELGLTLEWDDYGMETPIVRGMPYGTMIYNEDKLENAETFPTLFTPSSLMHAAVIDATTTKLRCSNDDPEAVVVQSEIQMTFAQSDMTWMAFFSEPVLIKCHATIGGGGPTIIQVVGLANRSAYNDDSTTSPLVVRLAVSNPCTNGRNPYTCKSSTSKSKHADFAVVLRKHANVYPGSGTSARYSFDEDDAGVASVKLDWDPHFMHRDDLTALEAQDGGDLTEEATPHASTKQQGELLMFALPHHRDRLDRPMVTSSTEGGTNDDGTEHNDGNHDDDNGDEGFCRSSMLGSTCLVEGNRWQMAETLPSLSFWAPRRPRASSIRAIGKAVVADLEYELPAFFQRGAGDTYFSGKMLAKLARILLVADELNAICRPDRHVRVDDEYVEPCKNTTLPSHAAFQTAVDRLQRSTQVWIDGSAETPFVYDRRWGGVTSCGCLFDGTKCSNQGSPICPAFEDQGLNFGNAYYNDQHFHYGYHIYAASVVAHFDPAWGRRHWEQVLLLVRSIANPSEEDTNFPRHRHKDWYQGSSWASGVPLPPYLNGKNQESSSEAIAAYEAVGLFGQVMEKEWERKGDGQKQEAAKAVRNVGRLLAATEIRSVQRYWHISKSDASLKVYPDAYNHNVIGIVWSSMAQFGTWFGNAAYLPYGIQLLPLTPISEQRDNLQWMNEMYYPFSNACNKDFTCTLNGWSFLELAALATVGHDGTALESVDELPEEAYESAGGNGHSKSNTLWYIATRPEVEDPIAMTKYDVRGQGEQRPAPSFELTDCYRPSTCTDAVLDNVAGKYTCRERIAWLIDSMRKSQWEACAAIADIEYPYECGGCNPNRSDGKTKTPNNADGASQVDGSANDAATETEQQQHHGEEDDAEGTCPPCTQQQCNSDLNRCPALENVFVCTKGPNRGGCSSQPWLVDEGDCSDCCDMTRCYRKKDEEAKKVEIDIGDLDNCPPCEKRICYSTLNRCPIHDAPFLCTDGPNVGGCSHTPWNVSNGQCSKCCQVKVDC